MGECNIFEVRTDDNRLLCMARLIEGDILLILKSAGKEIARRILCPAGRDSESVDRPVGAAF